MFIHFLCLCPLGLTITLNFNISKVAYCKSVHNDETVVIMKQKITWGCKKYWEVYIWV